MNVQLRSGTNALHGNLYEFLRNDTLDARNYFSPAPLPKDVLRRNQFGAVVSGPIVKDKLFFMVGWESQRNNQQSAGGNIVLTPAQRRGDFSALSSPIIDPLSGNPFPGNIIPPNRLDPVSVNLANTYMPLPNQPGTINYAFLSGANTNWDQGLARIDYRWRERDQFSGHYMGHNWKQAVSPPIPAIPVRVALPEPEHVSSSTCIRSAPHCSMSFDSATIAEPATRQILVRTPISPLRQIGINGLKQGGPNGRELTQAEAGFPTINISGYLGLGETGGSDVDATQTYQFVENVSLFRGKHCDENGRRYRPSHLDANTINWPYGQITFTSDIAGRCRSRLHARLPARNPDARKVSPSRPYVSGATSSTSRTTGKSLPRLTLNLGIRYDMLTLPKEINGNSRTLRFDLDPKGPVLWPPDDRTSAEGKGQVVDLWENEHWHIAPRFGFAYRLNDRTAVRGGYGIFTATNQFDHVNVLQLNPPMAGSITVINPTLNPVATIQNPVPVALVSENPAL